MTGWILTTFAVGAGLLWGAIPVVARLAFRAPRRPERLTPAAEGLPFSEVRIPTVKRKYLFGWLIPAQTTPAPAVVLLHGWGGNAQSLLPFAPVLHRAGFMVLLVAARNHGRSDGDGFSSMVKFAEDLEASLAWLRGRPECDGRLAVVGHSLGGAASLLVASRGAVDAVVSIASFAHPAEIMRTILATHRVPRFYARWLLRYIQRRIGARYEAIAPVNTVRAIHCPVLLVHGLADSTIPARDAVAIHGNRNGEQVRLLLLDETGHYSVDRFQHHGAELSAFLQEAIKPREGATASRRE